MIFTYIFHGSCLELSLDYYNKREIHINDYNITDIYVGF